jgi:hypothetical protein
MEYRRKLITGLIGFAMLATPIVAAAKDHDNRNDSNQPQAQAHNNAPISPSYNMPARPNHEDARPERAETRFNAPARNVAPETMTRHEFREQRRAENSAPVVAPAPVVATHRDWREDRRENRNDNRWNRNEARPDWRDSNRREYDSGWRARNYGNRGYYDRDDAWAMPRNYTGGSCGWARHLRVVYNQDRYSGHPAAAADLLPRLRRAERACGGNRYGYNRWHR